MNKLSIASFTNAGYRWHSRGFDEPDPDVAGKTALVTGATGGLGLAIARGLASQGARLFLVGRSVDKLSAAAEAVGPGAVTFQADLSSMSAVRDLARDVVDLGEPLEILINNVGVLNPERLMTDEGLEMTLATNLAGHFLLTNTLAQLLVDSAPARIVNVSSGGMYSEKIVPDDLQFEDTPYSGTAAYARTKRAQVILTEMWSERLAPLGVTVNSMHPGWARTPGVATSLPTFNGVVGPFLRTPEEGADTAIWLASDKAVDGESGKFWFDRRSVATHLTDRTRETEMERDVLWANLVALTGAELDVNSSLPARPSRPDQG